MHVQPSVIQTLAMIPSTLDSESAISYYKKYINCIFVRGMQRLNLLLLVRRRKIGNFFHQQRKMLRIWKQVLCVTVKDQQYPSIQALQCVSCHLLTDGTCCSVCSMYRKHLIVQHSRAQKCSTSVQKKINYSNLYALFTLALHSTSSIRCYFLMFFLCVCVCVSS